MNKIRRINLYAGPGSGKSTTATRLFSDMKKLDFSVEYCHEYVKRWAYEKRKVFIFDQVYIFAQQQRLETTCLINGVEIVVTDSPCRLSQIYSQLYFPNLVKPISELNDFYDSLFPPLNVFVDRGDKKYKTQGRFHSEDESRSVDDLIKKSIPMDVEIRYNTPLDELIEIIKQKTK